MRLFASICPSVSFSLRSLSIIILCVFCIGLSGAQDKTTAFTFVYIQYTLPKTTSETAEKLYEHHSKNHLGHLLLWLNSQKIVAANEKWEVMRLSDDRIFQYPMLFISNFSSLDLTNKEIINLKKFLEHGGFLYVEQCSSTTDTDRRREGVEESIDRVFDKMFPGEKFQVLPNNHEIYHIVYDFPNGLPAVHGNQSNTELDPNKTRKGRGGEGFFHEGRMVAFYSDADNCCAWNFNGYDRNGPIEQWDDTAMKMSSNIIVYAMTH